MPPILTAVIRNADLLKALLIGVTLLNQTSFFLCFRWEEPHSTTWRKRSQTGLKTKKVLRQELQLSKQSPAARGRGQGGKTGQILIAARFIRNRRISEPHCT